MNISNSRIQSDNKNGMRRWLNIFSLSIISGLLTFVYGQEGNYKLENYGNEAALLNGNVTGSISDLSLTYYNPSKLSFIEESKFLISVKAYQWSQLSVENNYGDGKEVSDSEFNAIPSMIAGEFSLDVLPNHKFAYSLISRYRTDRTLVYKSGIIENGPVGGIEDAQASIVNIDLRTKLNDEWFGLTWAHKLNDNFGVGASAFLSIYDFKERGELLISALEDNDEVALLLNRINYGQKAYGIFLKLGMTYNISDIELGANISLPYLGVYNDASIFVQELTGGIDDNFELHDEDGLNSKRKTALGVAVGAGIPIGRNKKSKIHLNAEWFSKVDEYERISLPDNVMDENRNQSQFNEEFKSTFNFGIGANIFFSPKVTLILSGSSDFNAHVSSVNILDELNRNEENVNLFGDFWHIGLGTDLSIAWGNIYTGITYSQTSTNVNRSDDFIPEDIDQSAEGALGGVEYQRFRVIIGVDLPSFKKKFEDKLEKLNISNNKKD